MIPRALLLALVLLAPAALADNTADEADLAFVLGNEAYAKGHYADALRNYFVSQRLAPNKNVLFNIARCYEALGRFDEAYRYFHELSAQELSADDRREVEKSLLRIRPRVALVTVTSTPPGAEVFVDREDLGSRGRTPLSLALAPGKHELLVRKEGYHREQRPAELVRGKELRADLALSLVTGKVALAGAPAGAWVRERADGPILGTVPCELSFPPGKQLLLVGAPGHLTAQHLVEVAAERAARLEVQLRAEPLATGKLIVTANREDALVRVDGKDSGFTPTVLNLPEGEHTVELSYRDLRPFTRRVRVVKDQQAKLHVELRYAPPPVQAASKRLLSVDEAPASTTVISAEEIRAFGYSTLAEALQAVRGLFVSDDRQYQYLGVRGFAPPGDLNTRVLILWDGHAMNDVWAGQGFVGRDLAVDLEEVDRIEIVRGPGSALYGTGAFFAVINVVPRDRLEPRRNAELLGGVGGLGGFRGHLAASVGDDPRRSATFSFAGLTASGAERTELGEVGAVSGMDRERVLGATARGRLGDFTAQAFINSRRKEVPTAPYQIAVGHPGARITDSRAFAELRFDRDLSEKSSLSARLYFDATRYDGRWPYEGESADEVTLSLDSGGADWAGSEVRLRQRLFEGNELTAGVEAQAHLRVYQQFSVSPDEGPAAPELRTRTLLSAYALDEWRLHPRVTVSAGLRIDRYLDLGVTPVTPRVALIARPYEGGLTKVVAGTAFRAPTFFELHYSDQLLSQRPSDGLEPETTQTVELEHGHDLTEELRLTVSGYLNRLQKLVALEQEEAAAPGCGEPLGSTQCLVNVNLPGTLQALGAEAEVRWQPGRFALVDVAYSFVNIRAVGSDVAVENLPAHLVSGRLMVPLVESAVRLTSQAVYQAPRFSRRVPSGAGEALLLSFGVSGERDHFRYFAGVQNLLDQRYALPVNDEHRQSTVPQYGRTFLIQVGGSY